MTRRGSCRTSLGSCGSSDPWCSRRAGRSSCTRTRLRNRRRPDRPSHRSARRTSIEHTGPCPSNYRRPRSRRCTKGRTRTTGSHTNQCPSIRWCRGPFRTQADTHRTTRLCSERRTGWPRRNRRDRGRTEHRRTRSHTAFLADRKRDRRRDRPSCTFPPNTPRCRWRGTLPCRAAPCPAAPCRAAPCPAPPCPAMRLWRGSPVHLAAHPGRNRRMRRSEGARRQGSRRRTG